MSGITLDLRNLDDAARAEAVGAAVAEHVAGWRWWTFGSHAQLVRPGSTWMERMGGKAGIHGPKQSWRSVMLTQDDYSRSLDALLPFLNKHKGWHYSAGRFIIDRTDDAWSEGEGEPAFAACIALLVMHGVSVIT